MAQEIEEFKEEIRELKNPEEIDLDLDGLISKSETSIVKDELKGNRISEENLNAKIKINIDELPFL